MSSLVTIHPSELGAGQRAQVLEWVNSVATAREIARGIEFPNELDIGERLGQRILDRRALLGGQFRTVEQLANVPLIGPERFTELVSGILGLPLRYRDGRDDSLAAQLDELRRQLTLLTAATRQRTVALTPLGEAHFVGQALPILVEVRRATEHESLAHIPVTLTTNWGLLGHYRDLAAARGNTLTVHTDIEGQAKVILLPAQSTATTVEQQMSLDFALGALATNAATPLDDSAGFAALAASYLNPRNDSLRGAIDIYYQEARPRIERLVQAATQVYQWVHQDVLVNAFIANADGGVAAHALLQTRLKEWVVPWYRHFLEHLEGADELGAAFAGATRLVGDDASLSQYVVNSLHSYIAGQRGLAAEGAAQALADRSVRAFLADGTTGLSASTQTSLFSTLKSAATSIRSSGLGTLAAVHDVRGQLLGELDRQIAPFSGLQAEFAELAPQLASFEANRTQLTQQMLQTKESIAAFQLDKKNVDGQIAEFDTKYADFTSGSLSISNKIDAAKVDLKKLDQFNADYATFNLNYNDLIRRS